MKNARSVMLSRSFLSCLPITIKSFIPYIMTNTEFIRSRESYQTPEMTALELMSDANLLLNDSYNEQGLRNFGSGNTEDDLENWS